MPLLTSYLKLSPLTTITMEGNLGGQFVSLKNHKRSTINWIIDFCSF
jgi:hypothetical protein